MRQSDCGWQHEYCAFWLSCAQQPTGLNVLAHVSAQNAEAPGVMHEVRVEAEPLCELPGATVIECPADKDAAHLVSFSESGDSEVAPS